jgi:hypothetical protein
MRLTRILDHHGASVRSKLANLVHLDRVSKKMNRQDCFDRPGTPQ